MVHKFSVITYDSLVVYNIPYINYNKYYKLYNIIYGKLQNPEPDHGKIPSILDLLAKPMERAKLHECCQIYQIYLGSHSFKIQRGPGNVQHPKGRTASLQEYF